MSSALVRLTLLQFVTVIYCILVVGFIVKARFGSPAPPFFASYLRDYGVFLLFVPSAWCIWGALHTHVPRKESGDARIVFVTGIILFAALVFVAFTGTISAFSYRSLVLVAPAQRAAVTPQP
ncbi:MAG: hypothetical protein V4710_14890 [Verrucomicrobiota bacterium]